MPRIQEVSKKNCHLSFLCSSTYKQLKKQNNSFRHLKTSQILPHYFAYHGENLDKLFTLRDCPYKLSEINVLSELKVE